MFSKLSGEQKVKKISKAVKQLSFILSKSEDDLKNLKIEINIAKAEYNGDHIQEIYETISNPEIQNI